MDLKKLLKKETLPPFLVCGENSKFLKDLVIDAIRSVEHNPMGFTVDVHTVAPEKGNIGIDQIHEAERFLIHSPDFLTRKYLLILDADRMTQQAANAFLKTLEEPPRYARIILTTTAYWSLLSTIRSRTMKIRVQYPLHRVENLLRKYPELEIFKPLMLVDYETLVMLEDEEDFIEEIRRYKDKIAKVKNEELVACLEELDPNETLSRLKFHLWFVEITKRMMSNDEKEILDFILRLGGTSLKYDHVRLTAFEILIFLRELTLMFWSSAWEHTNSRELLTIAVELKHEVPVSLVDELTEWIWKLAVRKVENLNVRITIVAMMLRLKELLRGE
ncbi:MAG: hypothetical protein J7L52_08900 [Thermotogae bacterium]|nr:hypothetical protein [Thermotogota bacterium]